MIDIDGLASFILARLSEDEVTALMTLSQDQYDIVYSLSSSDRNSSAGPVAAYLERLSPARALADARAKRRVVSYVLEHSAGSDAPAAAIAPHMRTVLAMLAEPYEAHPQFDQRWRMG